MAESQDIYAYPPQTLAVLEAALSPARLKPYQQASKGDKGLALALYLWNARIAKAFLFPLHVAEVTTRNTMFKALAQKYGNDWLVTKPFALTPESTQSLQRAFGRLSATPTTLSGGGKIGHGSGGKVPTRAA